MWISVNPDSSRWLKRVLDELLGRVRVRAFLLLGDREGAELALHAADVRLVQIQVLDEVDLVVSAALAAREVRELAEREHVVGLHQREPVLEVEALARLHLLADRVERRGAVENGHHAVLSTTASAIASSSSRASTLRGRRGRSAYSRGDLPRLLDRAAPGDAQQRSVERAAGQRAAHDLVLAAPRAGGQSRDPLAQVRARRSSRSRRSVRRSRGSRRRSGRRSEREAELAELRGDRFEEAGGLEELRGLEGAAPR